METERLFGCDGLRFGYYDELWLFTGRHNDTEGNYQATRYFDPVIAIFFSVFSRFLMVFSGHKITQKSVYTERQCNCVTFCNYDCFTTS